VQIHLPQLFKEPHRSTRILFRCYAQTTRQSKKIVLFSAIFSQCFYSSLPACRMLGFAGGHGRSFAPLPIMKKINYLGRNHPSAAGPEIHHHLPKTDFPMKAKMPRTSLRLWLVGADAGSMTAFAKPAAVLPARPARWSTLRQRPIHMGHASTKCLKDFIVNPRPCPDLIPPTFPDGTATAAIEIKVTNTSAARNSRCRSWSPRSVAESTRRISRPAARAVQAHRSLRSLGQPTPP